LFNNIFWSDTFVVGKQKKRILHVTSGLGLGGAETMLYRLVRSLHQNEDQEHSIITLTDNCSFDLSSIKVSVDVVDLRRSVSGLWKVREIIKVRKPDLIQAWMYHGNFVSSLVAPLGIPVIWGIHHSLHDLENEKPSTRAIIKAGAFLGRRKNTKSIVFVSEKSKTHHCQYGYPSDKSIVIPNGFDCFVFSPDEDSRHSLRQELGFTDDHILVGNFGRYHPVKDHELLLRAFAKASMAVPMARMVLAGTEMTEKNVSLTNLIHGLGLGGRVLLLGQRNDMPRLYNALDIYALSSRSEAFPNVLGEASACGVPSISTDVGDTARIIGDTGRVVPPCNVDALAEAMSHMLLLDSDARRFLGALARKHVVDRFGLPVVACRYAKLYDELCM
jgi:glycosyltransferase involved in cell wall biosynthesis